MNNLDTIIDDSLKIAHIRPCGLNFADLRCNARLRAKASGMEHYYRVAERAFMKPEMAKKILQYLLTNLSAMISESVYIGYAISGRESNPHASQGILNSLYDIILSDRNIIGVQPKVPNPSGVDAFRENDNKSVHQQKVNNLYSWHKGLMLDLNLKTCYNDFTLAGLFQYSVLWKPTPNGRPGDPTAICQKLLRQYVYPIEEGRRNDPDCDDCASSKSSFELERCRNLTEFVFGLRNYVVHHNFIPDLEDSEIDNAFKNSIESVCPGKYTPTQNKILRCIAMTIATPYVVSGLFNGPELSFNPGWLARCPWVWAKWKGQFPDYPMVDPILGPQLIPSTKRESRKSQNKKFQRRMSAVGYGIGYVFSKALFFAFLIAIAVFVRALVHNWRGNGFSGFTTTEEIHDYVESMNDYDRALLFKERRKLLKNHPEFLNEQRENELSRRYSDEHWPETSFLHTMWHVGTPRWLHSGQTEAPVVKISATNSNLTDYSNPSLD